MNEWHDLFVATAGASAALTGLIFVGVSINLAGILSISKLRGRALDSLILLMTILIIFIILLILSGNDFGLYWIIIAFILNFIKAMADAWVLLIEINQ